MTKSVLRVLGWAAVSTKDQAEDVKFSIPGQLDSIQTFCEKERASGKYDDVVLVDTIVIRGHSRRFRTLDKLINGIKDPDIKAELLRFNTHLEEADFDVMACRDANRFARKASLLHEIAGMVIEDCKARIYSFGDGWGWVDKQNANGWLAIKGYETENQMHWLSETMQKAKYTLVEQGLPHGVGVCWAYKLIRSEKTGKAEKLVPDPAKRYIIEKAVEIFVNEKLPYRLIGQRLWDDFQIGNDGKPFSPYFFYNLFWNPTIHGNMALNHRNPYRKKGLRVEPWIFDPSAARPSEVYIRYNVVDPALPAALLTRLQQELLRRYELTRNYRSGHTHFFTGLIVCGHCGHKMVYSKGMNGEGRWQCRSKFSNHDVRCEKQRTVQEWRVIEWLSDRMREAIRLNASTIFKDDAETTDVDRIELLKKEIARAEGEAGRLVVELRKTAPELVSIVSGQLAGLGTELKGLKQALQEAESKVEEYQQDDASKALNHLRVYDQIEDFWKEDENTINQLLRRAMGKRRIVIVNRRVAGTRHA